MRCDQCKFWMPGDMEKARAWVGACHRYAPRPMLEPLAAVIAAAARNGGSPPEPKGEGVGAWAWQDRSAVWPATRPDEGCGEFQPEAAA